MLASGLPVFCFSNCLENGSSAQGMFSGICWKKSMFKLGRSDVGLHYLVSNLSVEGFKFLGVVSAGIDAVFLCRRYFFVLHNVRYFQILGAEGSG